MAFIGCRCDGWFVIPAADNNSEVIWEQGESCDDGGISHGDGCDATCKVEPGWTCEGEPSLCSEVAAVPMLSPPGVALLGGLLMIAAVRRLRANASPT